MKTCLNWRLSCAVLMAIAYILRNILENAQAKLTFEDYIKNEKGLITTSKDKEHVEELEARSKQSYSKLTHLST